MNGHHLCVVAARKGSRRLPEKNKLPLAGRPMYAHTVEAAVKSGLFDRIVCTTDDEDILAGLAAWPEVRARRRPEALATGQATMMTVLRDLLDGLAPYAPRTVTLLTPCHPFRTAAHLRESHELFSRGGAQGLVSVTAYHCPPRFALTLRDGFVERSFSGAVRGGDEEPTFHPNGAVTILDTEAFLRHGDFYPPRTLGYVMHLPDALDIDNAEDYALARNLGHLLAGEEGA